MKNVSIIFAAMLCVLVFAACGPTASERSSEPKMDVDIPKDKVKTESIVHFFSVFDSIVQEGSNTIDLRTFMQKVNKDESSEILNQIIESRNQEATVDCLGRKCRIESLGSEFTFTFDKVDVPILGKAKVTLSKRIEIFAELTADLQSFNICRVSGVKLKSGFVSAALDGAVVELEGDSTKTMKVDVGAGGRYPDDSCR